MNMKIKIPKQWYESWQLTMLSSGVRVVDPAETEWINIFVTIELCLNGRTAVKFRCHGNHDVSVNNVRQTGRLWHEIRRPNMHRAKHNPNNVSMTSSKTYFKVWGFF